MPTLPLTRLRAARSSQAILPIAYTIAVSGTEDINCPAAMKQAAEVIGQELARRNQTVVVNTVTGIPLLTAISAKNQQGKIIGFSTAISDKELTRSTDISSETYDVVVYTGTDYDGRNNLMLRSCHAIIFMAGHSTTLPEFTTLLEEEKVIGVLTGAQTTSDEISQIVAIVKRGNSGIIYESDPIALVDRVIIAIQQRQVSGKK